jgi:glutathione synthase/RimK-type ligase-like ATP-grasp enzyme
MNKKLLILMDKIGPTGEKLAESVGREFNSDSQPLLSEFSDLFFEIKDGNCNVSVKGIDIREFGLVYFRRVGHEFLSTAGTLAICLDNLGIRYIDSKFKDIGPAGDKFTALTKMMLAGVDVPETIYVWHTHISEHTEDILKKLGSPVIAKDYGAQRNSQIFILRERKDFEKIKLERTNSREGQFLFQKYIGLEKEYRLLVLGSRVAVVHTKAIRDYSGFRVVDDTPSDNYVFIDPEKISRDLKEMAVKAAQVLGVEVAGVDACIEKGTGKNYILEVNRGPGFLHDPAKSPELPELAKFLAGELNIHG